MTAQYQHTDFGYNYRMTDISAAIGRVQLKRLSDFTDKRREIAKVYNSELSSYVQVPENRRGHVFHQYTIRTEKRDELREYLAEKEIGSGIYYPSLLYHYPAMSNFEANCPNSEKLIKEVLSLPIHPSLSDKDVFTIISAIKSFFIDFWFLCEINEI